MYTLDDGVIMNGVFVDKPGKDGKVNQMGR